MACRIPARRGGRQHAVQVAQLVLGSAAAGNMTVSAPANAVTGAVGNIELSSSGLHRVPSTWARCLQRRAGLPAPTIVRVDQP